MSAVLKIGYNNWAFSDPKKAMAAMAALNEGVQFEEEWDREHGPICTPTTPDKLTKVSLEMKPGFSVKRQPVKAAVVKQTRQLGFNGKVHYQPAPEDTSHE